MHKTRCFVALLFGLLTLPVAALAQDQRAATQQFARDIFEQLIEINTTDSQGNTTEAAEAMAARLQAAGFPAEDLQVLGPHPRKGNLVARLRGDGSRAPLLLLAHLDVVEARREDWSVDPEIMEPIERITEAMWPGVPVVPTMLTGATDGLALRNAGIPTYGVSGLFGDVDDVRAHGQDERIGVEAFYEG